MPKRTRREPKDEERLRAFGQAVRSLRRQQGLTQEALAERATLTAAEVGFVERAEREVGITLAWRLADGLSVSVGQLLDEPAASATAEQN